MSTHQPVDAGTSAQSQGAAGSARLVATLTVAGLLSGVAIVGAWEATRPTILANQAAALRAAVFEVVPGAEGLQRLAWTDGALVPTPEGPPEQPVVYGAYGTDGNLLGYAIPADGPGFQDRIALLYGYSPDAGQVIGMRVLESRETPGLGDKIFKDQVFVGTFEALDTEPVPVLVGKGKKTAPHEVEAISGATISSKAVVKIIASAHGTWAERLPDQASAPPLPAAPAAPGGEEAP